MNTKERIQHALKQERGLRLTAAEVQGLASFLKLDFPVKRRRRRKPSPSKPSAIGEVTYLIKKDMPTLQKIEQTCKDAWSKEQYTERMRHRNCIALAIRVPCKRGRKTGLAGAVSYALYYDRLTVERIVVDPECRLQSFGRQLMEKLKQKLSPERRQRIETFVDEADLGTLSFFQALGFTAVETVDGKVLLRHWWNESSRPFESPEERPGSVKDLQKKFENL